MVLPRAFTAAQGLRDDASIVPYRVCDNAGFAVSRSAAGPPWFVGEGFIPPVGVCGAVGVAGGACPSPTCLPATTGHTGRRTPARRKPIVGADSISARGVCGAAGCGGMRASRPTVVRVGGGRPGLARNTKFIRRGGIYCARRRVSEANRRAAAALGPEIPPGVFAAARGARDDASIVPYRGLL